MQGDPANPGGTADAFRKQIRKAASRYRLERLAGASWQVAWAVAVTLLVILLLVLATPLAAYGLPIALAFILIGLVAAFVIYRSRLDRHRLCVRMDVHAKLPDSVLSAGDWESVESDPWRQAQRDRTLCLLDQIEWRQVWPVCWPRLLWLPLAASAFLIAVIGFMQHNWTEKQRQEVLAQQQENAPVAAEQLKPLQQVFQDWDDAQKIAPSPELEELLKEIKPLRDKMADGQMTQKELFLKLNEVQARLEAARDKLEASSLEPQAQSMADAVKDLDGMSGLAAALQRKDFAAAREQAAQAQQKYNSGEAKMPEGANAQAAASKLGEASQQMASSNPEASSAMKQMQNSLPNKDSSSMSKGLGSLKDSLGQQAQKQSQSHNLGTQLAQLGECKGGMCNNPGNGAGMKLGPPRLSLAKSMQPGKGAGSETDPNRFGAQTQLDANHQEMKITGTAGDGASETQTESTKDPHFEQTAGSMNAAQFSAYKKMSEEATEDESLPVADRQMIKHYFENIRPQSTP